MESLLREKMKTDFPKEFVDLGKVKEEFIEEAQSYLNFYEDGSSGYKLHCFYQNILWKVPLELLILFYINNTTVLPDKIDEFRVVQ